MDLSKLGDRLQRYREERKLSQAQLAKLADVQQSYVAKLETAKVGDTDVNHLDRLASALGISLDDLLVDYINTNVNSQNHRESELMNKVKGSNKDTLRKFSDYLESYIDSINK